MVAVPQVRYLQFALLALSLRITSLLALLQSFVCGANTVNGHLALSLPLLSASIALLCLPTKTGASGHPQRDDMKLSTTINGISAQSRRLPIRYHTLPKTF
ncbi:hypothetical protein B0T24DRAFT_189197 [Lasiosphaeria ovina]|uniref:Uncharacterized protein n=1 Tax=Lasiosphaeria ovina TaxID=92902 RepID=A0AAE0NF20_9PEZI|nr:hypothetical protein B0T24DRAFT_189197 [Lasiosphaeria ovina]